jgi:hypothetical protein
MTCPLSSDSMVWKLSADRNDFASGVQSADSYEVVGLP